ncbi:MAG: hypothetical protein FWD61_02860 [Phycisphaerales bacterium]|nr:hypothetical protein [Phycisphaerales bacterium]
MAETITMYNGWTSKYCVMSSSSIEAAEMFDVRNARDEAKKHATLLVESVERDVDSMKQDVRLLESSVSDHSSTLGTISSAVENNKTNLAALKTKIDGGGPLQAIFLQVSKDHIERIEKKTVELRQQGESLIKSASTIQATIKQQSEAFSTTLQQATADNEKTRNVAARAREECQKSVTYVTALNDQIENTAAKAAQAISQATASLEQNSARITASLADREKKFVTTIADVFSKLNAVREQSIAELQRQNELSRQSAQTLTECTERLRAQTNAAETRLRELSRQGEEKHVASIALLDQAKAALAQAQEAADMFQRYHETARWKGFFGRLRWLFWGAPAPVTPCPVAAPSPVTSSISDS